MLRLIARDANQPIVPIASVALRIDHVCRKLIPKCLEGRYNNFDVIPDKSSITKIRVFAEQLCCHEESQHRLDLPETWTETKPRQHTVVSRISDTEGEPAGIFAKFA
jgi:hypothetical protein